QPLYLSLLPIDVDPKANLRPFPLPFTRGEVRRGVRFWSKFRVSTGEFLHLFHTFRPCFDFRLWTLFAAIYILPRLVMAQTNQNEIPRWLAKAERAPPFEAPASLKQWETKRKEVRSRVWQLLGKLPPRPKELKVQTLSREDRTDYVLE